MGIPVHIKRLDPSVAIPEYKTPGACAFDLAPSHDAVIPPHTTMGLKTGLVICVPEGHTLLIATRSSTPKKLGLIIPHAVGIVDNDYCGPEDEILLALHNTTDQPVTVTAGQRLCQGLIVPIVKADFIEVQDLQAPTRGGWGSTG